MTYEIVVSSPQAAQKNEEVERKLYPFEDLAVGQSFLVPFGEVGSETAFRMTVSRQNKKSEKAGQLNRFRVVKHGEPYNVFEVARIA